MCVSVCTENYTSTQSSPCHKTGGLGACQTPVLVPSLNMVGIGELAVQVTVCGIGGVKGAADGEKGSTEVPFLRVSAQPICVEVLVKQIIVH